MHSKQPVLDHGYVQLIETWGSDERIIESARMSTDGAFRGWRGSRGPCDDCDHGLIKTATSSEPSKCPSCEGTGLHSGDEKLLRYLYSHKHMTPFY